MMHKGQKCSEFRPLRCGTFHSTSSRPRRYTVCWKIYFTLRSVQLAWRIFETTLICICTILQISAKRAGLMQHANTLSLECSRGNLPGTKSKDVISWGLKWKNLRWAEQAQARCWVMRLPGAMQGLPRDSMERTGVALRPLQASLPSASCVYEPYHTPVDEFRLMRADFHKISLMQRIMQCPLSTLWIPKGRNAQALCPLCRWVPMRCQVLQHPLLTASPLFLH